MRVTLAAAALLLLTPSPAFAAADPARYMPAELVAETLAPKPGSTILIGFRMTPKPGWHGYWSNPGDSGIAPSVEWSVPKGVSFGPLLHPAPTLIRDGEISSFVHNGPHVLLARMTITRSIAPGTPIPIEGKLSWAACTASQCVPLHGTFTLDLTAGDGAASANSGALQAAEAKLPAKAADGTFSVDGNQLQVALPATVKLDPRTTQFFPDDNDLFETAAGRVSNGVVNGRSRTAPATTITGVVSDGRKSYRVTFDRMEPTATVKQLQSLPASNRSRVESEEERPIASAPPTNAGSPPPNRDRSWLTVIAIVLGTLGAALLWKRQRRR